MKIVMNDIEYDYFKHLKVVGYFGGIDKIKEKIKSEQLLFGEEYYFKNILKVDSEFVTYLSSI